MREYLVQYGHSFKEELGYYYVFMGGTEGRGASSSVGNAGVSGQ